MTLVLEVDPARPETARPAIRSAAEAIAARGLVVFPTETVYGLAGRPDDPGVTERIFEAKLRSPGLSLPVLASSEDQAFALGRRTAAAEALADRFWPGPLTLVLDRTGRSRGWYLGEREGSIGVRVPDHPISLALLEASGPLATTSANVSGRSPILDPDRLVETLGESVAVYLVLPAGVLPPGQRASTIVDLTGPEPDIIREGPVGREALSAALEGSQAESTG